LRITMDERRSRRYYFSGLIVIIVILMIQNFFLVRKNDALLRKLESAKASLSERSMLSKGDTVYAFRALGLDGERVLIDPRNKKGKTLLFMFSTRCPFCAKNVEHWNRIVKQTAGMQIQILGISIDSLERTGEFISRHGALFPPFSIVNDTTIFRRLRLELVPQTLLLDPTGRVLHVWGGLLNDTQSKEVIDAL
jgi:peroxiredoxin